MRPFFFCSRFPKKCPQTCVVPLKNCNFVIFHPKFLLLVAKLLFQLLAGFVQCITCPQTIFLRLLFVALCQAAVSSAFLSRELLSDIKILHMCMCILQTGVLMSLQELLDRRAATHQVAVRVRKVKDTKPTTVQFQPGTFKHQFNFFLLIDMHCSFFDTMERNPSLHARTQWASKSPCQPSVCLAGFPAHLSGPRLLRRHTSPGSARWRLVTSSTCRRPR